MSEMVCKLAAVREARGVRASELALSAGVARQTIYAIEAGSYVPNTAVALRLSRALGVAVEELFALPADETPEPVIEEGTLLLPAQPGDALRCCRVEGTVVAVPAIPVPEFLPEATALLKKSGGRAARFVLLDEQALHGRQVVIAGCDPAISFLSRLAAPAGIEVIPAQAGSRKAIDWLKQRRVHIAGSHLADPRSGAWNTPYVSRRFAGEEMLLVTWGEWQEGWAVARGNPRGIRGAADLARKDVRLRNREAGSGARVLLDELLRDAGVAHKAVSGYGEEASGHLSAAHAVSAGQADCCIATAAAARAFHLDFLPVRQERYDFVLRKESLTNPALTTLLDLLQRATLRRKLQALAGFDTTHTGAVVGG